MSALCVCVCANMAVSIKWGCDLSGEHEQHLLAHCGQKPLFVTDFPTTVKPFYAKQNETFAAGEGGMTVSQ